MNFHKLVYKNIGAVQNEFHSLSGFSEFLEGQDIVLEKVAQGF